MARSSYISHPMQPGPVDDPMAKMRRRDDDRPALMREPPLEYDRQPNYMEQEWDRFRSDRQSGPVMGRMPDDRDYPQRKVVSIFDLNEQLHREYAEDRGPIGGVGNRVGPGNFGRHMDEDEMMYMQRGRPLIGGSMEPRRGGWDDSRTGEHDNPRLYDHRMQEDRRMPPENNPVPSILDMVDHGNHEFGTDRRQQRAPGMDSMIGRDQGLKRMGNDWAGPPVEDDFKQSQYYQNELGNMSGRQSGRSSIGEHGSPYGRNRDDRNNWAAERSNRFESEETPANKRQSNQPAQSSEQSDPVSLLLNLSQLLA